MASVFDFITANIIAMHWNNYLEQNYEQFAGEELFPARKKLGLNLAWLKGSSGLVQVINPSAYDVATMKIPRIGFEEVQTRMPFFKMGTDIDEELRQQLNMAIESGNRTYVNTLLDRVMDDLSRLLKGARSQRERMRMMLLTTGAISIQANGQNYDYDYGFKPYQKVTVTKSWSDPDADIITDVRTWMDSVEEQTGTRPARALVSVKTMGYLARNNFLKSVLWGGQTVAPIAAGAAASFPAVTKAQVQAYFLAELGLTIREYGKRYVDESGATRAYVPDDVLTMFPSGNLGYGWFGTTPEESDLMTGAPVNVSIVDTGVAITISKKIDPVNVFTKVSMIYMPSLEMGDSILIADLKAK